MRDDLAVDVRFTDPTRDELRVLGPEVDDEDDITLGQNLLSVLKGVGVVVLILALVVIAMRALEVIASRVEGFSFDCEWFRDHLGKVGQFLFPRA